MKPTDSSHYHGDNADNSPFICLCKRFDSYMNALDNPSRFRDVVGNMAKRGNVDRVFLSGLFDYLIEGQDPRNPSAVIEDSEALRLELIATVGHVVAGCEDCFEKYEFRIGNKTRVAMAEKVQLLRQLTKGFSQKIPLIDLVGEYEVATGKRAMDLVREVDEASLGLGVTNVRI